MVDPILIFVQDPRPRQQMAPGEKGIHLRLATNSSLAELWASWRSWRINSKRSPFWGATGVMGICGYKVWYGLDSKNKTRLNPCILFEDVGCFWNHYEFVAQTFWNLGSGGVLESPAPLLVKHIHISEWNMTWQNQWEISPQLAGSFVKGIPAKQALIQVDETPYFTQALLWWFVKIWKKWSRWSELALWQLNLASGYCIMEPFLASLYVAREGTIYHFQRSHSHMAQRCLNSNCSRLGDVYQSNDNCFLMFFVSTGRFCIPTIRMPNSGRSRRTKKTPQPNTHVQERNTLKMEELKKKNSFKTLVAGNLCPRLRSQSRCQSVVIISASCLFLNKLFRQECLLVWATFHLTLCQLRWRWPLTLKNQKNDTELDLYAIFYIITIFYC